MKVDFDSNPYETQQRSQRSFSLLENRAVDEEVAKLLKKKVIMTSVDEPGQVVSPIFVRPKKNGSYRMILNLKELNESIEYKQFKMETLQSALNLISENCYFASVDLRDAYYTVPLAEEYKKFFKFRWRGQLFCFQAAPMGCAPVPRLFTKLTKPIMARLHEQGHSIMI
jgi:hypothetical protein